MESTKVFRLLLIALVFAVAGSSQAQQAPLPSTVASTVDRQIDAIETLIVGAAEAMPEGRFNFSPEILNIPGSNFAGVRTFGTQLKHVAASNYALWSPLIADEFPKDFMG